MTQLKAAISHHEAEVATLRTDKKLTIAYLNAALESFNHAEDKEAALLALRAIAEAHGGLSKIAKEAGIQRESLYRALSPKGNPTFKTLLAVIHAAGAKLTVEKAC